ncbi:MAG TPA: hypothetical protein VFY64_04990 [Nitrososphaeraceae archaeon]|nr:hypothetical protein [Nitrososphaeraceae archaeon]
MLYLKKINLIHIKLYIIVIAYFFGILVPLVFSFFLSFFEWLAPSLRHVVVVVVVVVVVEAKTYSS